MSRPRHTLAYTNTYIIARYASWIMLFKRNPRFSGYESQLMKLEESIFAGSYTIRIAITRLRGIGMTQLVLELIYQIRNKYKNYSVIWILATNMESLY